MAKRKKAKPLDFGRSVRIRFERGLNSDYGALRSWFARSVLEWARSRGRVRRSAFSEVLQATDCILANLIDAHRRSLHCFVAIPLSEASFTKTQYFKCAFGYTNFVRVIDFLKTSTPPFVIYKEGFNDPVTKAGRVSRFICSESFLDFLGEYVRTHVNRNKPPKTFDDIDRLFQRSQERSKSPRRKPVSKVWIARSPSVHHEVCDCIRLKDVEKTLEAFVDTEETRRMRKELQSWNDFLTKSHHIDLLLPDAKIEKLYERDDEDLDAFLNDERDKPRYVEFQRVSLYRVFNNSSFDEGGRFYGGWWQQLPSEVRQFVTINGRATWEYDYSNLHPAMLYAEAGLPLADDAYEIEGIDPARYRKLIKTTFLKLINAQKGQRIDRPRDSALPKNWTWEDLQKAIILKHEPIAKHFRSGVGLKLQKRDAEIAKSVMLRMSEKNILVLPVHDSFITYHELENDLQQEMQQAYSQHTGAKISIKPDISLVRRFMTEIGGFKLASEDVVDHLQAQRGYSGYHNRHVEFWKGQPAEWRRRFD